MTPVTIRVDGSIDKALKQFKRKCIDAGIYNELKRVAFYEKPSEIRRKQDIKKEKVIRSLSYKKLPQKTKLTKFPPRPGGYRSR